MPKSHLTLLSAPGIAMAAEVVSGSIILLARALVFYIVWLLPAPVQ